MLAYRAGTPVLVSQFLTDARRLIRLFPRCTHVLNLCTDRYHFTVGLAAARFHSRIGPSALDATELDEIRALGWIGSRSRFDTITSWQFFSRLRSATGLAR